MYADDEFDEDDFIFNEYTIDDTLDSLSRLEKYHNSDFSLQRLVLVRDVYDTAVEAGYDAASERLLPLLANFVSDTEPAVRQVFAEQLFPLATFFLENAADPEAGYSELLNTFIPYTFELIIDKNIEVGQAATEALLKIAELIKKEHIEPQLLSVIVNLAHDERVEEYRTAAARLFNELSPIFGERVCREVVVQELVRLSEDPSLLVRKTVAQNLGKICKIIGSEVTMTKVLPMYTKLSKDDIWGVRKACAESLPAISRCVGPDIRSNQLAEVLFENFVDDVSRWVKFEAYRQLGAFIATFGEDCEVPINLIQHFTDMALQSEFSEGDMVETCAFNFPAVVVTVGRDKWDMLEGAYVVLVKDVHWKVRKSLAYSLHEIANVVGTEITERTLTQAFELFLKDLDEVKIGIVSHLAEFLRVLSEPMRVKYLQTICQLPHETDNWRIRKAIARQLGALAQLFSAELVRTNILELVYSLFDDPFAEVRKSAIASSGTILKQLESDPPGRAQFIQFLKDLTKGQYFQRQMFLRACQYIVKAIDEEQFDKEFLPQAVELANDSVPNVRITLAELINNHLITNSSFRENTVVLQTRQQLKEDDDVDVRYASDFIAVN